MRESGTVTAPPSAEPWPLTSCICIDGTPDSVPVARHWITSACQGRDELEIVELLSSEVITNAVRHTRSGQLGGRVRVLLELGQGVLVLVRDQGGDAVPVVRPPDGDRDGGRGLDLVNALASEWGHLPIDGGRIVWFRVDGTADQIGGTAGGP